MPLEVNNIGDATQRFQIARNRMATVSSALRTRLLIGAFLSALLGTMPAYAQSTPETSAAQATEIQEQQDTETPEAAVTPQQPGHWCKESAFCAMP